MTTTTDRTAPYYDPYDYDVDANAHAVWKRLRDDAPLYWNDKYGFFALSRFDDVVPAPRPHYVSQSGQSGLGLLCLPELLVRHRQIRQDRGQIAGGGPVLLVFGLRQRIQSVLILAYSVLGHSKDLE